MTAQFSRLDNLGKWFLLIGISVASVPMTRAAEPVSGPPSRPPFCHPASPPSLPCRPARSKNRTVPVDPAATNQTTPEEPYGILPEHVTIEQKIEKVRKDGKRSGLPPDVIESIAKDMEKGLREEAAQPEPEPFMTGILPGEMIGSGLGTGSSMYFFENGWSETVNGKRVMVYAGSMRRHLENEAVYYDPLTVHGFVIIIKGRMGEPSTTWNQVYTPTAVGSLHVVVAKGTLLTLQSRQGNKFLLNVETEQLTPLRKQ